MKFSIYNKKNPCQHKDVNILHIGFLECNENLLKMFNNKLFNYIT